MLPRSLHHWFLLHFVIDVIFAVPLFVAPIRTLLLFGWSIIDPLTVRLVAAALFGIGIASFLVRNKTEYVYREMLNLKLIWSGFAIFGILIAVVQGAPAFAWFLLAVFSIFFFVWTYYRILLR